MSSLRRRTMVMTIAILAGAGALGFAGSRIGLLERLDHAYSEWSLRSRVKALCEARMEGDLKKVHEFIIASCERRAIIGNALNYLEFDIKEIDIQNGVARVDMSASYKVPFLGLSSEPRQTNMPQRWVRVGKTWYWDPGPVPTSNSGVRPARKPRKTEAASLSRSPGDRAEED